MKQETTRYKICRFCGKGRMMVDVIDDGMDFYGHARGNTSHETIDAGCDCPFGRIEKKKQKIKKMCLNCKYRSGDDCKNKDKIQQMNGLFVMPKELRINNKSLCCEFWENDLSIFKDLLDN